ncbi:hypothetical protein VF14_03570 [Nostoc linckia z18]|uniref:Uncharacterized protein n=2 Tax=Nostoc linckia TaxID=92942 RepID=A0A9Q6ENG6_NOSLI|nr:hypothetical protein VF02_01040 [Nostoc linckia z1]PHJ73459.1 hypothetical protein VF05_02060 [Nostoc linckia z3]PHJ78795.1 hypothetical protein VF03_01045 [Nostoc linckia z2]PHJ85878.1 hypothetical protein VF06_06365 [Nostoc linckia z4]PHJ92413.1 hypothetical protein VF07_02350 [Nostoc linckia z6]PHK01391.1 hypothetical protein VF04_01045 [Nostoc linckia z7]PHK07332.1 hypothetical protein VF08_00905 [Nostoc linckia z8]PHK13087.1 hypothetical protein VF09_00995 [Nostoc linckia z9]PHK2375
MFESAANYLVESSSHSPPALIFLEGQYVFRWTEEGKVKAKLVSSSSVRAAFANEPVDSGWLGANIVRCGVSKRGNWSVRFSPPGKLNLLLQLPNGTEQIAVPMPGLVFFGIHQTYYIWAIKEASFSPTSILHHAPLPNVSGDRDGHSTMPGQICFGDNSLPVATGSGIEKAWQIFCNTPFTDHLIKGKSVKHNEDIRSLLLALSDSNKSKYPTKELVSIYGGQTTERLISRATRNQ